MKMTRMTQAETGSAPRRNAQADGPAGASPAGARVWHLRYFAAVAEAGTFTRAAERLFIAQPTLSQQIGRLEQMVGTSLLRRGRDGVHLTAAGAVLLEAARDVLSAVDHAASQTRQARPRFAFCDPPPRHSLPVVLAFAATATRPAAVLTGPAVITGPRPG